MYYRGAQSAVLVYDISSMTSFESVLAWVTELHNALEDDIRTTRLPISFHTWFSALLGPHKEGSDFQATRTAK